jgi:hypothetical protein
MEGVDTEIDSVVIVVGWAEDGKAGWRIRGNKVSWSSIDARNI